MRAIVLLLCAQLLLTPQSATAAPTQTPAPESIQINAALVADGTPQLITEYNGEVRTLFPYALTGAGELGLRLWFDPTAVYGVYGWTQWQRMGDHIVLQPWPVTGVWHFVVVCNGNQLANAGAMHWELLDGSTRGAVMGLVGSPRQLPQTGQLYLPVVLR